MRELIAALILAAVMASPLIGLCLYGLALDRVNDRRLARRRKVERAVDKYRPIRIMQLTHYGWAEVVPLQSAVSVH